MTFPRKPRSQPPITIPAPGGTSDPTPGNNSATATTAVAGQADLSVTKTDSPDPVLANGWGVDGSFSSAVRWKVESRDGAGLYEGWWMRFRQERG